MFGMPSHLYLLADLPLVVRPDPVGGLYLCGAGTHPGGGVTAASGHNAAQRIIKDRRKSRLPWNRKKSTA